MKFGMKMVIATLVLNVTVAALAHVASAQFMNQLGNERPNTFDWSANPLHPQPAAQVAIEPLPTPMPMIHTTTCLPVLGGGYTCN